MMAREAPEATATATSASINGFLALRPPLTPGFDCRKYYEEILKSSWSEAEREQYAGMWCAVVGPAPSLVDRGDTRLDDGHEATDDDQVQHYLSSQHGLAWAWITERSPDHGGVQPVAGY